MASGKRKAVDPLVKILLVDDHRLFRDLVKSYLDSIVGFSIVAEADNGKDAVAYAQQYRPHVCIMDITLKGLDGFEATRKIVKLCGNTHILAVSATTRPDYIRRMVDAGAKGYIYKDISADEFCEAVRAVAAGLKYFPSEIKPDNGNGKRYILSVREMQVIKLICSSSGNKEISNELDLSVKTVESYKARIMLKTGASSTAELVKYAIKSGIAQLD